MTLTKYKLNEIAEICNGATPSTSDPENYDGEIVWITPKDLSTQQNKYIKKGERNISQKGYDNCSTHMIPAYNILMSSRAPIGLLSINTVDCCTNQGFKNLIVDKSKADVDYLYYYLKVHIKEIEALGSGTTFKEVSKVALEKFDIDLPSLEEQKRISSVLSNLDSKISLNRSINAELERMAKEIYDYWFVQFEFPRSVSGESGLPELSRTDDGNGQSHFPDEHGRPYKSSGGTMVYNPVLKREVPEGWEVKSFADFVSKQNGDWGEENPTATNDIEVLCARGADIVQMEDLPHRYISKSHLDRLMKKGDIMVEISGGSPVQATGRCSYISEALLSRLGQKLVCSNFCQVVRVQDYEMSSYLYMTWDLLYKNDNMFKFEGKTSGIKNFQIDSFLQTKWSIPPHNLISKYQVFFDNLLSKKEALKKEITLLQNQRDELLPLLMTGQVKIK